MDTGTILVADDDRDIRALLSHRLRRLGYQTIEASDGLQALKLAVAEPRPDLLVLDIGMPGLDGHALLRIVQAQGEEAPPVIFLTARTAPEDRSLGLALGAADYVVKPYLFEELLIRLRRALHP